ncbi:MAG: hypothetical protein R3C49_14860 [Planctomycetaceae bacterium]
MAQFSSRVTLKCSASQLRSFLGRTSNLPDISDPDLELTILKAPETIAAGELIEFRVTTWGIKQRMQHRWTEVSDERIVAEQIEGPTRSWIHTQNIIDHSDGTCTLEDIVDFEPPGGMMGFVMTAEKISESLQSGMEFRYEALESILVSEAS